MRGRRFFADQDSERIGSNKYGIRLRNGGKLALGAAKGRTTRQIHQRGAGDCSVSLVTRILFTSRPGAQYPRLHRQIEGRSVSCSSSRGTGGGAYRQVGGARRDLRRATLLCS